MGICTVTAASFPPRAAAALRTLRDGPEARAELPTLLFEDLIIIHPFGLGCAIGVGSFIGSVDT